VSQGKDSFPITMVLGACVALLGALVLRSAGASLFATGLGALILTSGCVTAVLSGFRVPTFEFPAQVLHTPRAIASPAPAVRNENRLCQPCTFDEPATPIALLPESFLRWAERRDKATCIWAGFDRWVRDALHEAVGARRVRCYRRLEGGGNLISMSNEAEEAVVLASTSPALLDHVIATGRPYFRQDPENGEMIERLAGTVGQDRPAGAPEWLLPIRRDGDTIGVVVVGEFEAPRPLTSGQLRAIANCLELFWCHVAQTDALSIARRTDPGSGVLNRLDLSAEADRVTREAADDGEPVVVLALSVEGVRRLDDEGRWDLRNWVMQQIGVEMRRKLRSDDLIGRFNDDRFVALLRRLDLGLGQLIAGKLLESVAARLSTDPRVGSTVKLRCGLAGGADEPFEPILQRAFDSLQQARAAGQDLLAAKPQHQEVRV
jgi:GGDEF domain-containing protein